MENKEFDASLGGSEHLPYSANSLRFATSRSIEIAAMTESIMNPVQTKLIFQTLPVHMRRRVMSHNAKRLPRKLRAGHMKQLSKSGVPPKQKMPSRKYRRRPANLLDEYNRRQKNKVWLETHIWHAKRFHMIERWGHRLAYSPCDKAFRACYRASSSHCLIQDISYYTPILIKGSVELIKSLFSKCLSSTCGLTITAKAFLAGVREGAVHFFKPDKFPYGYIGKISFIWEPSNEPNKKLWLFVHPSQVKEVETILKSFLSSQSDDLEVPVKRMKIIEDINSHKVELEIHERSFNRFRLTGPKSQAVLTHALKCVDSIEKVNHDQWTKSLNKDFDMKLEEKALYWDNVSAVNSPSQLPPNVILGLVVRDPRLSRPTKRSKARQTECTLIKTEQLIKIPKELSTSPLWNTELHPILKKAMLSNTQFIEHITKTQLVPGEVNVEDPKLQSVPIVLVQRPGSQDPNSKKLGYGCSWDIIIPSGYSLPFWQTFIMFGARAGGLRETESLAFEMGQCDLPPDSQAGVEEESRIEKQLQEKYFKRPASKRVNYVKYGVNSPFRCHWQILLKEWSGVGVDKFFVLRDRLVLNEIQNCLDRKFKLPKLENAATCLVPIYIQTTQKGNLKHHALICLPAPGDVDSVRTLFEPSHKDPNEKLRKQTKKDHKRSIKQMRRKRIKLKRSSKVVQVTRKKKTITEKREPTEYMKIMRELWLPSRVDNVRNHASRELMGYIAQGAFSFSEAKSCGVGYIAYNALKELLKANLNTVLVRNTCSRKYRLARFSVIKS